MLAVELSPRDAATFLTQYGENRISFAAINSPSLVTLSGEGEILERIAIQLEEQGIFNRFLRVELAYHSPMMAELREELLDNLKAIQPRLPSIPLYSTVTGKRVDNVLYDSKYWYQNIRQPVLFADAISALAHDGQSLFLEVGPHPVLSTSIKEVLNHAKLRG
jgi:acyl transferase domain-containing protein